MGFKRNLGASSVCSARQKEQPFPPRPACPGLCVWCDGDNFPSGTGENPTSFWKVYPSSLLGWTQGLVFFFVGRRSPSALCLCVYLGSVVRRCVYGVYYWRGRRWTPGGEEEYGIP